MKPIFEIPEPQLDLISDVLKGGRPFTLRARGWSMAPTILSGDFLTLTPASPESLSMGDIVAFVREKKLFIHRVVYMDREARIFVTKGDAHRTTDPAARYENILGKVAALSRGPFRFDLGREPWKTLNALAGRLFRPLSPDPFALLQCLSRESLEEQTANHPPPAPPRSHLLEGKGLVETFSRWDDLFDAACSEGLVPLLHHNMKNLGIPLNTPAPFRRKLEQESRNMLARHILLYQEFSRVLSLFSKTDIPLIALKGPTLAHLYPAQAPRPSEDLDFLIKTENVPVAEGVLIQGGYKPLASEGCRNSLVFWRDIPPGFRIMVDLHTHFIGSPELAAGFEVN
ncbi:MAG: signal peptidase I, partial [Armatimonadetes bacterium]|nr:signal peptidase I [Armatimonadota bacterium]